MRQRKMAALALALVAATGLTACGDEGGAGSDGGGDNIVIGIKFDQPGLGLKEGNEYKGFDVDVATYVAKELGYDADKIEWKQAPTPQRETLIESGQVKLIFATYSISDERKQKVSFGGPYFIAGQDLLIRADDSSITGPDALTGKKLCSVTGSTSAKKVKEKYPGVQLQEYDKYSKCVEELAAGTVDALTTDNTILAGYAAQETYKGKLKVVGKTFTDELYGVGLKKGDADMCKKVNDALKKMYDDGAWQKAVDDNLGPSGFKADTTKNPPKAFDNC